VVKENIKNIEGKQSEKSSCRRTRCWYLLW